MKDEQEQLEELKSLADKLGLGSHKCGWFKGWIAVEDEDKQRVVTWTTDRNTHWGTSTAYSLCFRDNGDVNYFYSVITMHWLGVERQPGVRRFMLDKLTRAVNKQRK